MKGPATEPGPPRPPWASPRPPPPGPRQQQHHTPSPQHTLARWFDPAHVSAQPHAPLISSPPPAPVPPTPATPPPTPANHPPASHTHEQPPLCTTFGQWNTKKPLGSDTNTSWHGKAKTRELENWLDQEKIDVALLQEPGESPQFSDHAWAFLQSGNAALLVRRNFAVEPVPEYTLVSEDFDVSAALLTSPESDVAALVISVYRHCHGSPIALIAWLQEVLTTGPPANVIIGGDFNIHSVKYGSQEYKPGGRDLDDLLGQLPEYGGGCLNTGSVTWMGHRSQADTRRVTV